MDVWVQAAVELIKAVGYPIAVSIVLAVAIARVAKWLAPRADRVVDAHVATLSGMAESTRKTADTQSDIKNLIVQMDRGEKIDEMHEVVLSMRQDVGKFVCKGKESQPPG